MSNTSAAFAGWTLDVSNRLDVLRPSGQSVMWYSTRRMRRCQPGRSVLPRVPVRGSFSARVPRSSFARVRRVLVSHMEEEGEEQENEKKNEREDGKQRVERRVVESIKPTTS